MTSRRPAYRSPGGCRIEYHLEQEGHMLESDGPSEEDWDMVFDSYLLSEAPEDFGEVMAYLTRHIDALSHCYDDIVEVLEGYRSDALMTMLGFVTRHSFRTEDFEKITKIIYEVWPAVPSNFRAISIANVIDGICKKAEHVPVPRLITLQWFVYSVVWPRDFEVILVLLRIERRMNQLLPTQMHLFASTVSATGDQDAISEAIENERMLILHELNNEDRVPLRRDCCDHLPYTVRKQIGDESGIEDDLISILESQEFSDRSYGTANGILVKSEYDNSVTFFT